ncbi:MAG: HIT family protein [Actinomycetota bacterium]
MAGCTFCEIVAYEREAAVVLAEPEVLAFLDVRPLFPGHTLVVPLAHVATLAEVPDALAELLFGAARRLAGAMRVALGAEGTFVAMNDIVSQSVPHVHLHVVPRRKGDGLRGFFWPRGRYDDPGHAERIRSAIAAAL